MLQLLVSGQFFQDKCPLLPYLALFLVQEARKINKIPS